MSTMTKVANVPDRDTAKPGMAFFAGTGPQGATCGGCAHNGYVRQSSHGHWNQAAGCETFKSYRVKGCAMFKKLTGSHGAPVADHYPACKYYAPK